MEERIMIIGETSTRTRGPQQVPVGATLIKQLFGNCVPTRRPWVGPVEGFVSCQLERDLRVTIARSPAMVGSGRSFPPLTDTS